MKLLFIGHYKEGTGWSQAALNSIKALDSTDLDVVCRNIKLTNANPTIDPQILGLEMKDLEGIDYCIQNVLPHHMVGTSKFKKNIAYFVSESNTLRYNGWLDNLRVMDEIWVPNYELKQMLLSDGIEELKIRVVPYAFDILKYSRKYPKINFHDRKNTFKFYYIGELNDRKNIESIIRCFHSEFENYEQVSLILKVKRHGISHEDLEKYIANLAKSVKEELRIYKNIEDYLPEIIIANNISDDDIQALHHTCDCFIGPTHGEGWSIPAFEAMAHGKTPICSNEGGPRDFIDVNNKSTGWLVNGVKDICTHSDPAFPELFTGREEWFHPSESEIKKAMRFYYDNRDSIDRSAGLSRAECFSYSNIGQLIMEILNDK